MADHPVKVPPELAQDWLLEAHHKDAPPGTCPNARILMDRAAQWGADQELEACCQIVCDDWRTLSVEFAAQLRAARRPKPPTLAEQGIEALSGVVDVLRLGFPGASIDGVRIQTLTACINRLAELEAQQ